MLNNTILVTFAGSSVHEQYQDLMNYKYGKFFKGHAQWTLEMLKSTEFYERNKNIFLYKKYAGYFLWKPYIIWKTLQEFPRHSILYCDANLYFKDFNRFQDIFNKYINEEEVFFIKHWNRINKDWTKRDTFVNMNADYPKYWNAPQVWSVIQGWRSDTSRSIYLLDEYINYCQNENSLTELPNIHGDNYEGFQSHRWEQSILSILVERFEINCPLDSEMIKYLDKDYNSDLLKLKEEVDKNPLAKE